MKARGNNMNYSLELDLITIYSYAIQTCIVSQIYNDIKRSLFWHCSFFVHLASFSCYFVAVIATRKKHCNLNCEFQLQKSHKNRLH